MQMVNMAKTPDDVKKEMADIVAPASMVGTTSVYPYGLSISLDDDGLKKLGMSGALPQIGEMVHFEAMAKVTSASMNEREKADGTKEQCCRIELQITDMGLVDSEPDAMEQSEARRKRFYGTPSTDAD